MFPGQLGLRMRRRNATSEQAPRRPDNLQTTGNADRMPVPTHRDEIAVAAPGFSGDVSRHLRMSLLLPRQHPSQAGQYGYVSRHLRMSLLLQLIVVIRENTLTVPDAEYY
jgi:hypothetical protein